MVDVNTSRKRKSSPINGIFEIGSDDVSPPQSPVHENAEPLAKLARKEELTEDTNSNLNPDLSQTSVETNVSIQEKLMELQEENMKLKLQLNNVSCTLCKCTLAGLTNNPVRTEVTETDGSDKPLISIKFLDENVAMLYKSKFLTFIGSFAELTQKESSLAISISRNEGFMEGTLKTPTKSKRKRKKSRGNDHKELFVVDTTPSLTTRGSKELKYTSKYVVALSDSDSDGKEEARVTLSKCFNCEQNHTLKDCTEPKDYAKIKGAMQKMRSQQTNKLRYHLKTDQKYGHLTPGKISQQLKQALGLRNNEVPEYIHRMKKLGYPPGWIIDAEVASSNISLFDFEGKDVTCKNTKGTDIDPSKVVAYPGFNAPIEKDVKDDLKKLDCSPYSDEGSKPVLLQDIDDEVVPPGCEPQNIVEAQKEKLPDRVSPSLTDLEKQKLELLAALDDNITNGSSTDEINLESINNNAVVSESETATCDVKQTPTQKEETCEIKETLITETSACETSVMDVDSDKIQKACETEAIQLDNSQENLTIDLENSKDLIILDDSESDVIKNDVSVTVCENAEIGGNDVAEMFLSTPQTPKEVKKSSFGTPIIKSASPFNNLPHPDKFQKDVSPVINFENLPNSTGKYEQMTGVLQKVRKTLKVLNEKS